MPRLPPYSRRICETFWPVSLSSYGRILPIVPHTTVSCCDCVCRFVPNLHRQYVVSTIQQMKRKPHCCRVYPRGLGSQTGRKNKLLEALYDMLERGRQRERIRSRTFEQIRVLSTSSESQSIGTYVQVYHMTVCHTYYNSNPTRFCEIEGISVRCSLFSIAAGANVFFAVVMYFTIECPPTTTPTTGPPAASAFSAGRPRKTL